MKNEIKNQKNLFTGDGFASAKNETNKSVGFIDRAENGLYTMFCGNIAVFSSPKNEEEVYPDKSIYFSLCLTKDDPVI